MMHDAASPGCLYAEKKKFNTAYPFNQGNFFDSHARSHSLLADAPACPVSSCSRHGHVKLSLSLSQINLAHLSKSSGGAKCLSQSLQSYSAIPAVPRKLLVAPHAPWHQTSISDQDTNRILKKIGQPALIVGATVSTDKSAASARFLIPCQLMHSRLPLTLATTVSSWPTTRRHTHEFVTLFLARGKPQSWIDSAISLASVHPVLPGPCASRLGITPPGHLRATLWLSHAPPPAQSNGAMWDNRCDMHNA